MNPTVAGALIGAVGAIIVCLINNYFMMKKQKKDLEKKEQERREEQTIRDTKLDMQLSSIEKKLDEHNGYAEKIGSIEQSLAYIRGKMEKGVS